MTFQELYTQLIYEILFCVGIIGLGLVASFLIIRIVEHTDKKKKKERRKGRMKNNEV